jgi:hypothetical protein
VIPIFYPKVQEAFLMLNELVKLNVPCAPFKILISKYLSDPMYLDMLYQTYTYLLEVHQSFTGLHMMTLAYRGSDCVLFDSEKEPLMYHRFDTDNSEYKTEFFTVAFDAKTLLVVDSTLLDMLTEG